MRCRRAFEADLLAVLRDEGGDVEFLAHYPTCPDCAAELRVWGELDAMLRAGAPADGAHPTAEALLAFVDAPATLAAERRGEVERHVAACRVCADEARSLQRWDPSRLSAAAAVPAPVAISTDASGASAVGAPPPVEPRTSAGWLGRLVWHPAFAYALVVALLVPVLRDQLWRLSIPARVSDARREQRPPPPVLAPGGGAEAPAASGLAVPAAKAAPVPPPPVEARTRQAPAQSARLRAAETDSEDLVMMEEAPAPARAPEAEKKEEAASNRAPSTIQLADRMGHASPEGAALTGRLAAPPVLELRVDTPTIIPFLVAERGPLLRIVSPAGMGEGAVDVYLRARAGARELTQRITARANAIALQIPPHWLASGDYTITLTPVEAAPSGAADAARRAPAPITLGFSVGAPTATNPAR